jgi:Zn-dependent M16 (insulinase) family peptidase
LARTAASAVATAEAAVPGMEFLVAPTQVNFVGKVFPLTDITPTEMGSFLVVKKYMDTTYLWEKVRVQGGAYGGFSAFDIYSNTFMFLSYRDPNLEKTFTAFDQVVDFLANVAVSREELSRAIVGTIGDVDTYLLPDAKGFTSLAHYLAGYTQADRQAVRDGILSASASSFAALAAKIAEARERAVAGALSSKARIGELPTSLRDGAVVTTLL